MMKRFGFLVGLAVAGLVGCGASPETENLDAPVLAAETAQGVAITEETETLLRGSFTHADSLITFEARLEAPRFITKLTINGAAFEFDRDLVNSTLDIDGHANTLLPADSEALRRFEKEFERLGSPSKLRDAFFKELSLMAGAPKGTTLLKRRIVPKRATEEQNRGYCDSDNGITYLCGCNSVDTACNRTWIGYGGPEGNNPIYRAGGVAGVTRGVDSANYGGYVTGCTWTPIANHEHEVCEFSRGSSYHGRVTWDARCGWSASECEGRCGAGCPNSYNFYVTKDCLDHDVCANSHPSASTTSTFGDCGNEFDRASGDFSFGTGSGFSSACGSWMVGENSR